MSPFFLSYLNFWNYHWMLHLKGYKWLLSQNQRVRNDFFGYRWYWTLAKHIKPFLRKTLNWKNVIALTLAFFMKYFWLYLLTKYKQHMNSFTQINLKSTQYFQRYLTYILQSKKIHWSIISTSWKIKVLSSLKVSNQKLLIKSEWLRKHAI